MTSHLPSPQLYPQATHGPESALARAVVVYKERVR